VTSVVTVEFVEMKGGTEVRVTHEGLPSRESAGHHEQGWKGCLDKLQARALAVAEMTGPGHFSWNELLSGEVDGAAKFYTALFGWEAIPMPGGMPYTIFKKNGMEVAGLMKPPMPGVPPQWLPYVTVEAADTEAARIAELGGKIVAPPFDIPNVGRIAVARDPQGAMFGIFQRES
jgi:predicted enzyme related to lactoylglutathione lyase